MEKIIKELLLRDYSYDEAKDTYLIFCDILQKLILDNNGPISLKGVGVLEGEFLDVGEGKGFGKLKTPTTERFKIRFRPSLHTQRKFIKNRKNRSRNEIRDEIIRKLESLNFGFND